MSDFHCFGEDTDEHLTAGQSGTSCLFSLLRHLIYVFIVINVVQKLNEIPTSGRVKD